MGLVAEEVAFEIIGSLREALARLARVNAGLADQAMRAMTSVALNIGEGKRREGRDRVQHYRIAAGSAGELVNALKIAVAVGQLQASQLATGFALLDRELALLWGLTHSRGERGPRAAPARGQ
jgi:four helix bundle protein